MEKRISRRKFRLVLAAGFIRLHRLFKAPPKKFSSFVGSFLLTFLNPDELKNQVRNYYDLPDAIENECRRVEEGLSEEESYFVSTYFKGKNNCLVLGSGSGRESLALAKFGLEVTGIDTSAILVEKATGHARRFALTCQFEVEDMFKGPQTVRKYDILFLTGNMYSAIPTRQRRIEFLEHARTFLKEDGFFYLEFLGENGLRKRKWKFRIKKWLAVLCDGNRDLEEGDVLYVPGHYFHLFREQEFLNEIEEGGWEVVELNLARACGVFSPKKKLTEKNAKR